MNGETKCVHPKEYKAMSNSEQDEVVCDMSQNPDAVTEVADGPEEVTVVPVRQVTSRGRFVFDEDMSMALIYEVQLHGAHLYSPGKKQQLFEKVQEGFLRSREYQAVKKDKPTPSWPTLADRLFNMASARKAFVAAMKKKSGVEEEYGEKQRMLDAINEDIAQKKEEDLEARREKSARADALKEAGEATRAMATRSAIGSDDDPSSPRKKTKANIFDANSDYSILSSTVERQLKLDEERLKLDRERHDLAVKQAEAALAQQATIMDLVKELVSKK